MKWSQQRNDSGILFAVTGAVDEHAAAELQALEDAAGTQAVTIDLARSTHFNSIGLAAFLRMVERMKKRGKLSLASCPVSFVRYLTMVAGSMKAHAHVSTVLVPHVCACKHNFEVVQPRDKLLSGAALDAAKCPSCAKAAGVAPMAEEDLQVFSELLQADLPATA